MSLDFVRFKWAVSLKVLRRVLTAQQSFSKSQWRWWLFVKEWMEESCLTLFSQSLVLNFFFFLVQDYIKQKVLVCHAKPVPDTGRASLVNPPFPRPLPPLLSGSCYHLSPESGALVSSLWHQIFSCLGQVYVIQASNLIVTWGKVSWDVKTLWSDRLSSPSPETTDL